jgi:nicotinamide riboside kinase
MKIAISGTSSSGKSTLTRSLSIALGIPAFVDTDLHEKTWNLLATHRKMPSTKHFPSMTREEHINFERAIHIVQRDIFHRANQGIFDESSLDFLNWYYIVCAPHPELMDDSELSYMVRDLWVQTRSYDAIIYLPFGSLPVVNDNRRFTNEHQLRHWDYSLQGILQEAADLEVPVWTLESTTPRERLEESISLITALAKERDL